MSSNTLPQSGDPFAAAYSQNGNARQAALSEAARLRAADQAVAEAVAKSNDLYRGYGIPGPASSCPPGPEEAIMECLRALQSILKDTIQRTEAVPYHEPPFHARPFCKFADVVLSTTIGVDAATNAAGLVLLAANTVAGSPPYAPTLQEMTSATSSRTIFTLEPQQSYMARVKSWGISFGPSGPESVILNVKASTVAGASPEPPSPFMSSYEVSEHQDTFLILNGKQPLVLEGRLRDVTAGPVLVRFGICGWLWPINKRQDSREGSILRSGYGLDCP